MHAEILLDVAGRAFGSARRSRSPRPIWGMTADRS
jgi:hypothetical protein